MKKTQKVIESCYDCEFRHVFLGRNVASKAHICRHIKIIDKDEDEHTNPILLDVCDNGSHELPIPQNCPLEDYKY
jgi:hypothetical protein